MSSVFKGRACAWLSDSPRFNPLDLLLKCSQAEGHGKDCGLNPWRTTASIGEFGLGARQVLMFKHSSRSSQKF